jgi:hypothetical protein
MVRSVVNDIERLSANLEICALKARYFRTIDEKDWAEHEAVLAPDLVADFRASAGDKNDAQLTHGAAAYVAKLAPILEHVVTVHHGHTPEITILSDTEATGIWAMEDKLWVKPGSALPFAFMHGYGHYHEHYVRIDGARRIKPVRLTRLRVDVA